MLEIDKRIFLFKKKEIWFSETVFDVKNCDVLFFHECKNNISKSGFQKNDFTTITIDLRDNLEAIWQNIDKSSFRYGINKAQKDGVKIYLNQHYKEFYQIYREFNKKKGLPVSNWKPENMKKYGTLLVAVAKNKIIAGNFYLEDDNNIRWLLGASKRLNYITREERSLIGNANRLLIWETIKYAKNKGIQEFDFGGYYTGEKNNEQKRGINLFKKGFGGEIKTYYNYRKDYSRIFKLIYSMHNLINHYGKISI
ncbi:MAG: peptidoglycan bridge formation glycyltransferase FemA/FemB family protein [Candidatus Paceibacterota bacterium]|jgi:lipid II:glycine glycyltransferase (peptidoglycan interpeptide bridge formation enzyme)